MHESGRSQRPLHRVKSASAVVSLAVGGEAKKTRKASTNPRQKSQLGRRAWRALPGPIRSPQAQNESRHEQGGSANF